MTLIAFDWDGVIHEHRGWRPGPFGRVDVSGIREAHRKGYAVAIMTCNDTWRVAAELRRRRFSVLEDRRMERLFWAGGRTGRQILVTNRKVSADAYVDDKAVPHTYGQPWARTFEAIDAMRDRKEGFHPCPDGHRHWGRLGAAGILPLSQWRGQQYVLLGRRSKSVQCGGTWSTLGGAIEAGETPWQAAVREAAEEVRGLDLLTRTGPGLGALCPNRCGWLYATYVARVPMTAVRVRDAWESTAVRWFRLADAGSLPDLHPGLRASWPALAQVAGSAS